MARSVSPETRARISESMRGKRNAVGKHEMSAAGRAAIQEAQRRRWAEFRLQKEKK